MKLTLISLMIVVLAASVRGQQQPPEKPDELQQVVTNEDGGNAFIIKTVPLTTVAGFGQLIAGDIEQQSIFLGAGWAEMDLRMREPELSNLLLKIREHFQPDDAERLRIRNSLAPTFSQEKLDLSGNRNISDLEIQRVLAGMFKDGTLQPPRARAIYLIYLDPDLHSTLGALVAEKHYLAYHAFFNVSGARIHYVVVPYHADLQAARQIAWRAFVIAATGPANMTFQ